MAQGWTLLQEECRWFNDLSQLWEFRDRNWQNYPHFKHVESWIDSVHCPNWVRQKLKALKPATSSSSPVVSKKVSLLADSEEISASSLLAALKECSFSKDLERGKRAHAQAVHSGLLSSNSHVASALINMYAKCGKMVDARKVFNNLIHRDAVCWNCLIQGYADCGEGELALELFEAMGRTSESYQSSRTYVAAITACATLVGKNDGRLEEWLEKGAGIFSRAVRNRCCNIFVANSMLDFFCRCGKMTEAQSVFDKMRERDVVTWTTLMHGYAENGASEMALEIFEGMPEFVPKNARTYVTALTACASLGAERAEEDKLKWLAKGKAIHSTAEKDHCCDNVFVKTSLVDMYGKCGSIKAAKEVLSDRDVVTWNAMLQGYVDNGRNEIALAMFGDMNCVPNARSYAAAVTACANLAADRVAWDCLAQGFLDEGENEQALKVIDEMTASGVKKIWSSFLAEIIACGNFLAVGSGKGVHAEVLRKGLEENLQISTSLVQFYGKCGRSMTSVESVFDSIAAEDDVVAWKFGNVASASVDESKKAHCLMMSSGNMPPPPAAGGGGSGGGYGGGNLPPYNVPPGGDLPPNMPPPYPHGGNMPPYNNVPLPQGNTPPHGNMPPPDMPPPPPPPQGNMPRPMPPYYGGNMPPPQGNTPPPRGNMPPYYGGNMPPPQGNTPRPRGNMPPYYGGNMPPPQGNTAPPRGNMPPYYGGNMPPPQGNLPPQGNMPPPRGNMAPYYGGNRPPGGNLPQSMPPPYYDGNTPPPGYSKPPQYGGNMPPPPRPSYGGNMPPPPGYNMPPGNMPPPPGPYNMPPARPNMPPMGNTPVGNMQDYTYQDMRKGGVGTMPPGNMPPPRPSYMPPSANMPRVAGNLPPANIPKSPGNMLRPPLPPPVENVSRPATTSPPADKEKEKAVNPESYKSYTGAQLREMGGDPVKNNEPICSELHAIAYAMSHTAPGTTIRIVKDSRVCDDCHAIVCKISQSEQRKIICRDNNKLHVYENGECSCGNYW